MQVSVVSEEARPDGSTVLLFSAGHRTYIAKLQPALDPQGVIVGYTPVIAPASFIPGSIDGARDASIRAIERICGVRRPRTEFRRSVLSMPLFTDAPPDSQAHLV